MKPSSQIFAIYTAVLLGLAAVVALGIGAAYFFGAAIVAELKSAPKHKGDGVRITWAVKNISDRTQTVTVPESWLFPGSYSVWNRKLTPSEMEELYIEGWTNAVVSSNNFITNTVMVYPRVIVSGDQSLDTFRD